MCPFPSSCLRSFCGLRLVHNEHLLIPQTTTSQQCPFVHHLGCFLSGVEVAQPLNTNQAQEEKSWLGYHLFELAY